jgi:glutathione S-transferase
MKQLEDALAGKKFLGGDSPSEADAALLEIVTSIPSSNLTPNVQGWTSACFTAMRAKWAA